MIGPATRLNQFVDRNPVLVNRLLKVRERRARVVAPARRRVRALRVIERMQVSGAGTCRFEANYPARGQDLRHQPVSRIDRVGRIAEGRDGVGDISGNSAARVVGS